jgi:hypothetical protein
MASMKTFAHSFVDRVSARVLGKMRLRRRAQEYQYLPLDLEKPEIRLVHILPGRYNDPICIEIIHIPYDYIGATEDDDGVQNPDHDRFPKEFRGKIPEGWGQNLITDGRWLFCKVKVTETDVKVITSWDFPVPELAETL